MTADMLELLRDLRAEMVAAAAADSERLEAVHEDFRESARNLLHYLAFRRHDLRPLQEQLARLGLSSLGRAESRRCSSGCRSRARTGWPWCSRWKRAVASSTCRRCCSWPCGRRAVG